MISKIMPQSGPLEIKVEGFGYFRSRPLLSLIINGDGPFQFTKPSVIWVDQRNERLREEESTYLDTVFDGEQKKIWSK